MNITIDPIIVPTFNAIATICQNEVAPSLPTLSNNTIPISGTWSPNVINTGIAGPSNYVLWLALSKKNTSFFPLTLSKII